MKKAIFKVLLVICGLNFFTSCYGMPQGDWDRIPQFPEEQEQTGFDLLPYGSSWGGIYQSGDSRRCYSLEFNEDDSYCMVTISTTGTCLRSSKYYSVKWNSARTFAVFEKQDEQEIYHYFGTITSNHTMSLKVKNLTCVEEIVELTRCD